MNQIICLRGIVSVLNIQSDPLMSHGDATSQSHLSNSCTADISSIFESHVAQTTSVSSVSVMTIRDVLCTASKAPLLYSCTMKAIDWDLSGFYTTADHCVYASYLSECISPINIAEIMSFIHCCSDFNGISSLGLLQDADASATLQLPP